MSNQVLESVRALLPAIAERAGRTDESGRVPDETVRDLAAAGVFRMLQPGRHGGLEGDPVDFFRVVREIAAACASTGWVASVLGVHPWHVGLFDDRAQTEVWGRDRDTRISSSYAPVGRLVPDGDGGHRLSGRWRFSSGCEHADWALLGALAVGAEGRPVDFLTVLVPRSDYRIEQVWDVVGLRGTASNDIVVEDAVVPAHRVMRNYEQAQLRGPGQKANTGPLYRLPFAAVFTHAITAPLIGAAAGAHDHYTGVMRERVRLSLGGGRFTEDPYAQVAVARAACEIDAAVLQTERNLAELAECAAARGPIPVELRLRTRRDQVRATERAVEAVDLLFRTAGGMSLRRGHPLERAWRDVHAGSVHVANDVERTLAMYGRNAFGATVEDHLV
ncbi:3-hydroxy-9,10-secoandrosta-1,3,5(10)-triene-9,17-dione monooxygenase oxygenase subunit [Streptomyces sp. NPDC059506]|uniref:3-hydroxy-9,10-secoandrosta-1,3,5(10)-triene-9, 17-dione monooxygenase oxygenase subunit n=1 Tax=Streptomyces TaxID=1883 RepID=UPI000CAEF748|nr:MULTISPECIES: 3-hydroxy-9,10-secoandrosta-1,3,5(10)-triene-9,17-dione monooxygenase oxygenase subunit [unclassified Streptomyces]MCZ2528263.1 acyl-CoA dehydrogenase family protein [Streptomyces sp. HB2AG]PLW71738.1 flavin-dependent monooxygenase [Streptomyces sp. DJ]QMV25384.1 flavin-dependent monooxygenase [Streptomyces sp. SCUT-3]